MGRIVVTEFISLDGVMEAPGGDNGFIRGSWTFAFDRGAEGDAFKLDELREAEVQLLGRRTYDGFAAAWPSMTDEAGFADKMNSMPKYVISKTLTDPSWENTTVLSGDPLKEAAALRERVDGVALVAGSGTLARALLTAGLVDELRLMLFPVVLGTGFRLFGEHDASLTLDLAEVRPVGPDGVLVLTYRPKG